MQQQVLDERSFNHLIELLKPLLETEADRRAFLVQAFPGHPLVDRIDFGGATNTFLPTLISLLYEYGRLEDGRPALWVLLELAREQVGLDQKQRIDSLRPTFQLPPPPRLDRLFVSYSRVNERYARRIVSDLKDAGLRVWYDREKIRVGEEWWRSIERGIANADYFVFCLSPDSLRSENANDELITARKYYKPIFVIMVGACWDDLNAVDFAMRFPRISWLPRQHIIDFTVAEQYGKNLRELIESVPGYMLPDSYYLEQIDTRDLPNPFQGLEAFLEVDAAFFSGREDVVQNLVEQLDDPARPRLLAVVGASGSGKSSLVNAGLIPAMRKALPLWQTMVMKPGNQPLEVLSTGLEELLGSDTPVTAQNLRTDATALHRAADDLLAGSLADVRFVLVVDQFEELFTLGAPQDLDPFLNLLLYAVTTAEGRVQVIMTLRADFFDRLSAYPDLAALVKMNLDIATEMTPDQLRRSIEEPARKVGVTYEEGLVEQILEDVRAQPGSLPLLQYALKELFERRLGRRMTREAYTILGGVKGALASRAEAVYAALTPEQQNTLRRTLLRLVEVGEETVTRRRVDEANLMFGDSADETVNAVLQRLTDWETRLLVVSVPLTRNGSGHIFYEVSHEALLTHWGRLAAWIADNRSDLRLSSELLAAANAWDNTGRVDTSYLLLGARLAAAREWLERSDATPLQRAFVNASIRRDQQVRRQQLLIGGSLGVLVIALLALGVIFLSVQNRSQQVLLAEQERAATQKAQSAAELGEQLNSVATARAASDLNLLDALSGEARFRADQSNRELAVFNQGNALRLAVESLAHHPQVVSAAGHQALLDALTYPAQEIASFRQPSPIFGALLNADHTRLLTWSTDLSVRVWDVATGQQLLFMYHDFIYYHSFVGVWGAQWSADERFIWSWGSDGAIRKWDALTGEQQAVFVHEQDAIVGDVTFNPAETRMLTWDNYTVRLWDTQSEALLQTYPHPNSIYQATLNQDESRLYVTLHDGPTHIWGTATGAMVFPLGRLLGIDSVIWNPDRTHFINLHDGAADILDERTLEAVAHLETDESISRVGWTVDGSRLLSLTDSNRVQVWDTAGKLLYTLIPDNQAMIVPWSDDGTLAISSSDDFVVRVWRIKTSELLAELPHERLIEGALFDSRNAQLMTWEGNTLYVWRLASEELALRVAIDGSIASPHWLDDRQILAEGSDNTVHLWETKTISSRREWLSSHKIENAIWNPAGTALLVVDDSESGKVLDTEIGHELFELPHEAILVGASWNFDGSSITTWAEDGRGMVWDSTTGEAIFGFAHDDVVRGVLWNQAETRLLSWSDDFTVRIWDESGHELHKLQHEDWVLGAAWNADNTQVISWAEDATVRVWDVATGRELLKLSHDDDVKGAAWSPDGTYILTWSDDNTARVWTADTGTLYLTDAHEFRIKYAFWYPDSTRIVVIPINEDPAIWNIAERDIAFRMEQSFDTDSAFMSDDGGRLYTVSVDAVRLWDPRTGTLWMEFPQLKPPGIVGAALSADNRRLLTWAGDGLTKIWNAEDGVLLLTLKDFDPVIAAMWQPEEARIVNWTSDSMMHLWTVDIDLLLAAGRTNSERFYPLDNTDRDRFLLPTLVPTPILTATVGL